MKEKRFSKSVPETKILRLAPDYLFNIKAYSHGAIATAIYLSQVMDYIQFSVIVSITHANPYT